MRKRVPARVECKACGRWVSATHGGTCRKHRGEDRRTPCRGHRLDVSSLPLVNLTGPCPHGFTEIVCSGARYSNTPIGVTAHA